MTSKEYDELTNKIRNDLAREHNWQVQEQNWQSQEKQWIVQRWFWLGTVIVLSLAIIFK